MDFNKIEGINRTVTDGMSQNKVPTTAIRRRRTSEKTIARDRTPDPSSRGQSSQKNTDDDSLGSASDLCTANGNSISAPTTPTVVTPPPVITSNTELMKSATVATMKRQEIEPGGHMSKILSRREKAMNGKNNRSQSTPRKESETQTKITSVINVATIPISKRSMSLPRKPDESSESDAAVVARLTIPAPTYSPQTSSIDPSDKRNLQLEMNLRKFEEDRKKFELEKLRFIQQKRELDRMRLARFEKYKTEILGKESTKGLAPFNLHVKDGDGIRPDSPMPPRLTKIKSNKLKLRKRPDYASSTATSDDEGSELEAKMMFRKPSKSPRRHVSKSPRRHLSKSPLREKSDRVSIEPIVVDEKELPTSPVQDIGNMLRLRRKSSLKVKPEVVINGTSVEHTKPELTAEQKEKLEPPPKFKTLIIDAHEIDPTLPKTGIKSNIVAFWREARFVWRIFREVHPKEVYQIRKQISRCVSMLVVLSIFCGVGGLLFRYLEGNFENLYKCGVKRIRRTFIDDLWLASHNLREDDWKSKARTQLKQFEEELQVAFEAGVKSYSGLTAWNFVNSVLYCLTVVTTIGYGHIAPSTDTGKALTIIYALIGIPIFLIILADFGKLFTRGIKFLWAYVRRLYYTGSCRKVRKQAQVQEVMRGLNVMYDMVRRPSTMVNTLGVMQTVSGPPGVTPGPITPMPATPSAASSASRPTCESPTVVPDLEIDEEFNLPVTLALSILIIYMICGAIVYNLWEGWGIFNAFYFVFISMSTIGFGDYVPEHPMYMMCSIIYLIFGLALTSMCINVVQIKLSDTFRVASAKLGATIGLQQMAENASVKENEHTPVELASVHVSAKKEEGEEEEKPPLLPRGQKPEPKNQFEFPDSKKDGKDKKKKDGKK